ncbi:9377_t:CDS:2, partial [Acaulospora morrowiae]
TSKANSKGQSKFVLHTRNKTEFENLLSSLECCFNKTIRRDIDPLSMKSYENDKSTVMTTTIGKYSFGLGFMDSDSATQFDKLYGSITVAEDSSIEAIGLDTRRTHRSSCLTAITNSTVKVPNLDRIDQANLPLDGKYNFPPSNGSGVNVYCVDTGVNSKHAEFEGRATNGGAFCAGCPNTDDNGHGSNVAGIIGGKTYGVAKKCNIIGIKVMNASGMGTTSVIISGLSFIASAHSKSSNKNTVVNMSLRSGLNTALNAAVSSLTSIGIHVIVAAGNDASNACNYSPASEPSAIAVGATDTSTDNVASFSNTGKCVGIFAPGTHIVSCGIGSTTATLSESGTSQACPHVSGTIALMIALNGNRDPAQMKSDLYSSSTKNVINGIVSPTPNRLLRIPSNC